MSIENSNIYNPISNNVYSILDSLENKLSRYKGYSSRGVQQNINYYNNYMKKEEDINMNNKNDSINYNQIKKIVMNEFSQLILPYQKEFNFNITSLNAKINSINSKVDYMKDQNNNNNNSTYKNKLPENKEDYVSRKDYIELQNEISLLNSSISSIRKIIEKNYNDNNSNIIKSSSNKEIVNNEKNIYEEINKLKKSISQNVNIYNINPNEQLKEYDLKLNNVINNFNTMKEENKNLNSELSQIKEQMINETQKYLNETSIKEVNLNELKNLNNKIQNLENNIKYIEQNYNSKFIDFKKNINEIELKLNDLKVKNIDNEEMSIKKSSIILTNNNDQMLEKLVQKKLNELNLENNKYFQELNLKNNSKNEQIFKLLEEHDIIINNLSNKIEKIKDNFELENKKKFNHLADKIEKSINQLSESNIGLNYNESRIDTNIIGNENIKNINSQISKQNIKLETIEKQIKNEVNKLFELISNYDKRITLLETNNKKQELNNNISDKNIINNNQNNININNKENISKKGSKSSKKKSGDDDNLSIESLD